MDNHDGLFIFSDLLVGKTISQYLFLKHYVQPWSLATQDWKIWATFNILLLQDSESKNLDKVSASKVFFLRIWTSLKFQWYFCRICKYISRVFLFTSVCYLIIWFYWKHLEHFQQIEQMYEENIKTIGLKFFVDNSQTYLMPHF